jgi:hypothetical protein
MGQAAVDLPDPLDDHANPAGAAGGDDLLSQLAGDEIDRLLGETEEGAEEPALSSGKRAEEPDLEEDLPSPAAHAKADEAPEAPEADAPEASAREPEASGLDALFSQIAAGERAPVPADEPNQAETPGDPVEAKAEEADAPSDAAALDASLADAAGRTLEDEDALPAGRDEATTEKAPEPPPTERDEADGETTSAERSALAAEAESAVEAELAEGLEELEKEPPLPLLLRPLEWLNAPLAFLPEPARNALGKVAIVTLFNALAVLAYVLIFRKH